MKFGGKFFQTKLLSTLSHKACRLLSFPVLLLKFCNISSSHEEGGATKPTECFFIPLSRYMDLEYILSQVIIVYFVVLCVLSLNKRQHFFCCQLDCVKTDVAVCDFCLNRFIS